MKTRIFVFILSASLLGITGCIKHHSIDTEHLNKMNFDWDMTETKAVSGTNQYDVINQNGDTIAANITGAFDLHIAQGDILTMIPSASMPSKASGSSTIYFPADKEYASYWIEDNFPYKGDKDFNDVVFGMRYVFNMSGEYVTSFRIDSYCKASGSAQDLLGIALQLDGIPSSAVSSTGGYFKSDFSKLFTVNKDYIETGTTDAVIPMIGDFRNTYSGGRQTGMVNTFNSLPYINTRNQFKIEVTLNTPISYNNLFAALNPFVIISERGKEIHLKGKAVSSKFNSTKYPTSFVDDEGFVWMIMIPKKLVRHPQEMISIFEAYPRFNSWVFSEVQSNKDWYMFPNTEKVYKQNY